MTVKDLVLELLKHPLGMEVYAFSDNDETLPVSDVRAERLTLSQLRPGAFTERRTVIVIEGRE